MTRPLGDRRARLRFEVVGALWGTLDYNEARTLVDIGPGGALFESPVPITAGVTQPLVININNQEARVDSCVRHVTRVRPSSDVRTYRIGVEFINTPARLLDAIDQLKPSESAR